MNIFCFVEYAPPMDAYKVVNIYWRISEEGQKFFAQHYYDVLRCSHRDVKQIELAMGLLTHRRWLEVKIFFIFCYICLAT